MTLSSITFAGVMVLAIYYMTEDELKKAVYALALGCCVLFGGWLVTAGVIG